jgi:energy-coupling factor transporter ATP-binding protein EcfA2
MAELSIPKISIFGGEYNAKRVRLQNIAKTFVPPEGVFEHLIQQNNTLLIGPRGSGKTTLLKMLQGPALESWEASEASAVREAISYTGVFVPADQSWAQQLRADNLDTATAHEFASATFNLHCLRALVGSANERVRPSAGEVSHRRVSLDSIELGNLAQAVADHWGIKRPVADLPDLVIALTDAIGHLGVLRSQEALRGDAGRTDRLGAEPWFHISLLQAAMSFIERFNVLCDEPEGRWAFLFDEMELIPRRLESRVLGYLRGVDDRLLFKVSYAPYERGEELGTFQRPLGPQPGQDYSVLRLTYANKREGFSFSQALLEAELSRKHIDARPDEVLGTTSLLVGPDQDGLDIASTSELDYSDQGTAVKLLEDLARRDPSFEEYLARHNFDIHHLDQMAEEHRARVRKIMPLVAARLAYRRERTSRWDRLRGRQNVEFYAGAEAFFAMMEANPRWLKHVTDRLLNGDSRVPPAKQSRILRDAAEEFAGYLNILSMSGTGQRVEDGPKKLMDRIGEYFKDGYHRQRFNPDAPGSLKVDKAFPESVMSSLRALVNRGALIPVPERDDADLTSLHGKRFRLAYLQAPIYGLPLRLDRPVRLSDILNARPGGQMSLEDESE